LIKHVAVTHLPGQVRDDGEPFEDSRRASFTRQPFANYS
jgi:hypothetical protein